MDDAYYMTKCLELAQKAYDGGEVPVGAMIVKDDQVLGKGFNQIETLKDPTAHAEIIAIGAACGKIEDFRLTGAVLYSTLEPCVMCIGAIILSRLTRVCYAAKDGRFGGCGSFSNNVTGNPIQPELLVEGGLMELDSQTMLKEFFKELRISKKK